MAIFTRLFRPQTSSEPEAGAGTYREHDNSGTRHDTLEKATAYWLARLSSPKKDPFVMYVFNRPEDARAALLELPCIHEAQDTRNLVCSEVLTFGYYRTTEGPYEALVCGADLTHELWAQAHDSFARHGGRKKNDLEPEIGSAPAAIASPPEIAASKVEFVREDRQDKMGKTFIYRVHRAPDAASAQAFLEDHPVSQPLLYLIVETPEGTYARDLEGTYKE